MILFAALTNVKLFKYLIKKASCVSKRYFLFVQNVRLVYINTQDIEIILICIDTQTWKFIKSMMYYCSHACIKI